MSEIHKPEILVVDDEAGIRIGTKRLLEGEGFCVDSAQNGTEGLHFGLSKEYDLAIIDLKMPDIGGIEVLKQIKAKYPNTVCFIATAFASYETAVESTRIGAFGYIPKPFTTEELLFQVQKGISHRNLILDTEKLKLEREKRLLELADEQSRLSAIIKSINNGVLVINLTGEVVYYNNSSLRHFNWDSINIGNIITDKFPPEVMELYKQMIESPADSVVAHSCEVQVKPSELITEASLSSVRHQDGSLAGIIIVTRNITESKKIEMVKNQFVSMVAHEMKTPIAAVLGYIKILLDPAFDLEEQKKSEFLDRSLIRLTSALDLVNDLLDISRLEMKTKIKHIEEIDICEIIKGILLFLELEIIKRNLRVVFDSSVELPKIFADKDEINRIFTNILSNAVKYNSENGEIKVSFNFSFNYIVTEISDTGIGMKPSETENLFQEFFRAKNEKTKGISGTGLGLSIVKRLIESYDGKIEVDSIFGQGSTFRVYLPINK